MIHNQIDLEYKSNLKPYINVFRVTSACWVPVISSDTRGQIVIIYEIL